MGIQSFVVACANLSDSLAQIPHHKSIFESEAFAALAGAITGSVIGGLISWLLQRQSFGSQQKIRREERDDAAAAADKLALEKDSILAFSIFLKINRALTAIVDIHDQLHSGRIEGWTRRMAFGSAVKAFSTDPEKISFTLDELLLIKSLKNDNLMNEITDLPAVHAMYVDNMAVHRALRSQISDLAESTTIKGDGIASTEFVGAAGSKALVLVHQDGELLDHLWTRSWDDLPRTNNLFCDVQSALQKKIGRSVLGAEYKINRMREVPPPDRDRFGLSKKRPKTEKV